MKALYFSIAIITFFSMMLLPLFAIEKNNDIKNLNNSSDIALIDKNDEFLVLDSTSNKVSGITAKDYIVGVLSAEISPSYSTEAIKAQAVASYTYACKKRNDRISSGGEYDVSTDSNTCQAFLSSADAKEKWGDKADEYLKIFEDAYKSVEGYVIKYDGNPILAAYHCISGGKTESALNVWGSDYPYLISVESIGDLLSPDYLSEITLSADEFRVAAATAGVTLGDNPTGWINEPTRSDSGTVLKYTLGDKVLTGREMRTAFSLRSANFDLTYSDNTLKFVVRGYGHGVGMSQNGANYMALQGGTFLEILCWYYPGCQMSKA
ncbi:MAG: stage II sporulation protein D [Oscillospiraceae bacterium]|nr:stage II sporulation protein D [Oscillospiraceae bacterium]